MIDIGMFKVPIFDLTLAVVSATVIVQFGILVFLPLQLETVRGLTALTVGTMLVPMAIAGAITFPLGGRLTDRIGPRVPVVSGAVLLSVSAFILSRLGIDSPTYMIEVAVVCQGLGFGLAMMPNSVTGLNALSNRFVAQATAVRQLNVRVMASFGVAVLATVLAMQMGPDPSPGAAQDGYNTLFLIASICAAVGAVLALFLPGRERNRQLQAERSEEYQLATAAADAY
jgi:MFS family permease